MNCKKYLLSMIIVLFGSTPVRAFNFQQFGFYGEPIMANLRATALVAADGPLPMTHFSKDNWQVAAQPSYVTINTLYDDDSEDGGHGQYWEGDGYTGFGGSGGLSYALTDRWEFIGMISGVSLSGKITGSSQGNRYTGEGESSVYLANFGFGYDLLKTNENWSVIFSFGAFVGHFDMEFNFTSATEPYIRAESSGSLYGGFAGIQAARNIGRKFRIAPYYFMSSPLNDPEASITVTNSNGNAEYSEGEVFRATDNGANLAIFGCNITYIPFSLTLNLGGLVPNPMIEKISHGLEMTKISISYVWNND